MENKVLCPKCKTPLQREESIEPVSNNERKVIVSKLMDFKFYRVITSYCPSCNMEIRKKVPLSSFEYAKISKQD
jgi:predicted nucleic-acid-binding Zn-ribbon protein